MKVKFFLKNCGLSWQPAGRLSLLPSCFYKCSEEEEVTQAALPVLYFETGNTFESFIKAPLAICLTEPLLMEGSAFLKDVNKSSRGGKIQFCGEQQSAAPFALLFFECK